MAKNVWIGKNKDEETRIVGAYSHFPIIGGVLVPIIVYLLKKDENKTLSFQAAQAAIYQLIAFVILIVLWAFILSLSLIISGLGGLFVWPLAWLFNILILVAFTLYALYAAYKTYIGEYFEYIYIGKFVKAHI